ncbi:unnamed protein product [Prunus armeniaca]
MMRGVIWLMEDLNCLTRKTLGETENELIVEICLAQSPQVIGICMCSLLSRMNDGFA